MRWVHIARLDQPEERSHETRDQERCWCEPCAEEVRVQRAVGAPEGRKDFCVGRGHVIVAYSDDGSALYICEVCYAELVLEYVA